MVGISAISPSIQSNQATQTQDSGKLADGFHQVPMGTGEAKGQGFLGKATSQWANKALASLNQDFGRGTFNEGNRNASVEFIGGKPFLAVQNGPIAGKKVDESTQYLPLAQMGNGTFRLESAMERGPGIRVEQ